MDDPVTPGRAEGLADTLTDMKDFLDGQGRALRDADTEVFPLHQFHGVKKTSFPGPRAKDLDDIPVSNLGQELRFPTKAFPKVRVFGQLFPDDFDRDRPIQGLLT